MAESEVLDNGLEMTTAITVIAPAAGSMPVPAMVAAAGERAARRFIDFFTANCFTTGRTTLPQLRN